MSKGTLALALALCVLPVSAIGQTTNNVEPTADQVQAMRQAFEQFGQQEDQLHAQMRDAMLAAMTPLHRRIVGTMIGQLAVAPNPDLQATAKRIDAMLSSDEEQRIVAAHASFESQVHQLYAQTRQQMLSMMPAGHPGMMKQDASTPEKQLDAGTLLLMGLAPQRQPVIDVRGPITMPAEGAPPK